MVSFIVVVNVCVCLGKWQRGGMGIPTAFMAKLGKNPGISPYTALQTSLSHGKSVRICAAVCHRAVSVFQSMGCSGTHAHMLPRGHFHGLSDSVRRRSGRVLTRLGGTFPRSHTRKIPHPPATWPAEGGIFMKCICLTSEGIVPNRHRQLDDYSATQMVQRFLR